MIGVRLARYLVNAGEHPMWGDAGWQIAFDFGEVQVSIAETPNTVGVELMLLGLVPEPQALENVTPGQAVEVLSTLLALLEAKRGAQC